MVLKHHYFSIRINVLLKILEAFTENFEYYISILDTVIKKAAVISGGLVLKQ